MRFKDSVAFAFPMLSLPGVGTSGGFTFMLQDRGGVGFETRQQVAQELIEDGNAQSGLAGMSTTFRANVPQLLVDIDRDQVLRTGTPLPSVFETLQVNLGSAYVNDFTLLAASSRSTPRPTPPIAPIPGPSAGSSCAALREK